MSLLINPYLFSPYFPPPPPPPYGGLIQVAFPSSWRFLRISSDGTKQAAIGSNQIYTSTDSGVTWTARESIRNWGGLAMSSNGTRLTAGSSEGAGGYTYTSSNSGQSWTQGTQFS